MAKAESCNDFTATTPTIIKGSGKNLKTEIYKDPIKIKHLKTTESNKKYGI